MAEFKRRSRRTQPLSTVEQKYIDSLERQIAELQKANAKLLNMVELVMEQKFERHVVTGGIVTNDLSEGLPIETLNDVTTFDSDQDAAQMGKEDEALQSELRAIEDEHREWRSQKGLANDEETAAA